MELLQDVDVNFKFEDDRGKIVQLIREGYKQVNVITSRKGVIRGNHYHKINSEAFYFPYGRCIVTASDIDGNVEKKEYHAGDMFKIAPYVMHSFEYLEESMVISMYSIGVELGEGKMDSYIEW